MKKLLTLALALVALAILTGPSLGREEQTPGHPVTSGVTTFPGTLIWTRPAIPAHNEGVERCHGNWAPFDNTNNWKHQPSQGPDHMVKKNGRPGDRSCMKCPNGGTIQQDFMGLEDWCVKYLAAVPAATATPSCLSGFTLGSIAGLADSTPWLNRDQPGGVGDYETTKDHLKIACRFSATGVAITDGAPKGYHCNIPDGGWCKNNDPARLKCEDMEVMFSWAGGATRWLNRDQASGVGDYETTKDHLKIACRFSATGVAITDGAPKGYHCNIPDGGWCKNNDPARLKCEDMEVMFSWAKVAPVTTAAAYYWIDPKDRMAEKACTVNGGVISTKDGRRICAVQPVQVMTSFVITDSNPYSAKACSDKRGVISTNMTGRSVCNLPAMRNGWGSCETCNQLCSGPCFLGGDLNCICYPSKW